MRDMLDRAVQATGKGTFASLCLLTLLLFAFSPAIFGGKTLLLSSWDAPSILSAGAHDQNGRPLLRLQRTPDPGAPAWQTEPWLSLISDQLWNEFNWPLWNPYNAFGTPLAASQQPQPFFPLAILLSLHLTAWTYNLFIVGRIFLGGILMYLFARQFLTALPSLFSAVTFSLSGYFIVFLNMPHISVEVLTPGVMLACELLLKKNSWTAVSGLAVMIFLGMTAGMPESLFLVLAFASLYFVCRFLFSSELRAHSVQLGAKFALAVVFGFSLSAFLLFPFLEFLHHGYDVHQSKHLAGGKTGLIYDADYRLSVLYLLPLVLGPVLNSTMSNFAGWSGLKAYWGIVPFFFLILGLLSLTRRRLPATSPQRFAIGFFAATLVLMLLKRFGSVLVNWIGYLPVLDLVLYPKYLEPLIAFCVAMLAGFGFAALVDQRIVRRHIVLAGTVTFATMLVLAMTYFPASGAAGLKYANVFFYSSIVGGGLVIAAVALLSSFAQENSLGRIWLLRAITVLLCLELTFNFIVPSFYLLNRLPPVSATPYVGAPYIHAIQEKNTGHARIFGRENILYPNWSAAFKMPDVRSLDAIHYVRYRSFVRNFLLASAHDHRIHGDLADRFTGQEFAYTFETDLEKRFLALSSVKYLITDSDYGSSSKVLEEIIRQHEGEFIWGFGSDTFRVGAEGKSRLRGLFQHAPSARVSFKTIVNPQEPFLEGVAIIKGRDPQKGDGAGFRLELKEGDSFETLFESFLDPVAVPTDKAGRAFRIDLSKYAGKNIELFFSTDPGPKGDNEGDWAGWAGLRFVPATGAPVTSAFERIYDGEASIYEVPLILPRASLYRAIEILPDDEVLVQLKNPAFDPREKAIVSRESLLAANQDGLAALAQAERGGVSAAVITEYRSQYVRIECDAASQSLLVLNDSNYPGWQAYLNGQPLPSVMANYLFRGVLVPSGKSTVEFRYEPMTFRVGGAIAIAAFATLAGLVYRERRKRIGKPPRRSVCA